MALIFIQEFALISYLIQKKKKVNFITDACD